MKRKITDWYKALEGKNPSLAKLIYQLFYFVVFSLSVTIVQFLILMVLPKLLGIGLAGKEAMWPSGIHLKLLGVDVNWCLVGAEVLCDQTGAVVIGGGLGAAIANWAAPFVAQCINFPLQRNITFKSDGNVFYQLFWYFFAWILISLATGGLTNLVKPVIIHYAGMTVYTIFQTVAIGGVSMVIMFFVFKIIFPEGEAAKK